jgi:protein TonB
MRSSVALSALLHGGALAALSLFASMGSAPRGGLEPGSLEVVLLPGPSIGASAPAPAMPPAPSYRAARDPAEVGVAAPMAPPPSEALPRPSLAVDPVPAPPPVREAEIADAIPPESALAPVPAMKPKPPATPAKSHPPVEQAKPKPAPAAPGETRPALAAQASATASDEGASSSSATASSDAAAAPNSAAGAASSNATTTHAAGLPPPPSEAETANYGRALGAWLDRHKRYPDRARRKQQEGVVTLEFAVDTSGRVLRHRILESSGYTLLDAEVEALIVRASPLPPPPGGGAQTYVVPIVFALR